MTARPTAAEAQALLRDCHTRRLDREGIPMVLALVDERRPISIASDASSRREGARYAELLASYTELLCPAEVFPEDDEGGVITAMQVLAYEHFLPEDDS
ncbi:MAG: hypothetical protein U0R80_05560 [Nocardioidaceae bacterium]